MEANQDTDFGGGGWRVQKETTISMWYSGFCSSKIVLTVFLIFTCVWEGVLAIQQRKEKRFIEPNLLNGICYGIILKVYNDTLRGKYT